MNQVLPKKKVLFICNTRLFRKLLYKNLGEGVGIGAENVFSKNTSAVLLDYSRKHDLIFYDPGHPLNATLDIDEIQQLSSLPLGDQILKFNHPHREDWFFDKLWQALTEQEINFLYLIWLKKINFFLECNPNIVLIPVTGNFLDSQLPLRKCVDYLDTLNRKVINCKVDSFSKYPFEDEYGYLNDVGWKELEPRIREVING